MSDLEGNKFSDFSNSEVLEALNSELGAEGLVVSFTDLKLKGDVVSGAVRIVWKEKILGRELVLIDAKVPFSFRSRAKIFEASIPLGPLSISVSVDAFFKPPRSVCIEARAKWPGGSVGAPEMCEAIPTS